MRHRFERICIHLSFVLGICLLFQLGIQSAGAMIRFGEARKVEIINRVVEQVTAGVDREKMQQTRDISIQYIKAYLQAIAGFEFVPRNDMDTLAAVIGAAPRETTITHFEYEGRDLLIDTLQPEVTTVERMVSALEESGLFSNVLFWIAEDEQGSTEANIRCIAHQYESISIWEGIKEFLKTIRALGGRTKHGVT